MRTPHRYIAIVAFVVTIAAMPLAGCSGTRNHDYPVKVLVANHSSVIARHARDSRQFARLYMRHFQYELEGATHPSPYSVYRDLSADDERYYVTHAYSGASPDAALCQFGSMKGEDLVLLDLTFETLDFLFAETAGWMADAINEDVKTNGPKYGVPVDSNGNAVAPVTLEELVDLQFRVLKSGLCDRLTDEAISMN